jgi:hypothetical protein
LIPIPGLLFLHPVSLRLVTRLSKPIGKLLSRSTGITTILPFKTAFRWLRILCDKYEHEEVYREQWAADGDHPAATIYKCQICGAISPTISEKGWSLKVALLSDRPERHDPENPLSRRWPIDDIPVELA